MRPIIRPSAEREQQKRQAKKLVMEGTMLQKQIAQTVDVSEKTLSKWIKEYRWKRSTAHKMKAEDGTGTTENLTGLVDVESFAAYLREFAPTFYRAALAHLSTYFYLLSLKQPEHAPQPDPQAKAR